MKNVAMIALLSGIWVGTSFADPVDNQPPVMACLPDRIVTCSDDLGPAATGVPSVWDASGRYCLDFADTELPSSPLVPRRIQRTWMVTDAAGLSRQCRQLIQQPVVAAPVFHGIPSSVTLFCGEPLPAPPPVTATLTADPRTLVAPVLVQTFLHPRPGNGIAVAPDGRIYVSSDDHLIRVYSPTGALLSTWGGYGSAAGKFNRPAQLAFDAAGRLLVADRDNHRVQVFKADGTYLFAFGGFGNTPGKFNLVDGVGADPVHGRILVADRSNHRVQVFDAEGIFQFMFGHEGLEDGAFQAPGSVEADVSGRMFVSDLNGNRIQVFSPAGEYQTTIARQGSGSQQVVFPRDMAIDPLQRIVVVDTGNQRVHLMSATGSEAITFGSRGVGPGQFTGPHGVAVDAAGRILVVDGTGRVQIFAAPRYETPVAFAETVDGECPGTITRTWSAVDACGIIHAATQTFVREPAPSSLKLIGVPGDLTVSCTNIPPPARVTAIGGCAPEGLVLHYTFDEPADDATRDDSGGNRHGILVGEPTWTKLGRFGGAYQFDGVNDHIRVPTNPTASSRYTVALWFRSAGASNFFGRNLFSMNRRYQIGCDTANGQPFFYSFALNQYDYGYDAVKVSSQPIVPVGDDWHHIALVVQDDPVSATFYLDGQPIGSGPGGGMVNAGSLDVLIGALNNDPSYGPRYFWQGLIDDVRMYDRALDAGEIAALLPAEPDGLLLHYRFDEPNGDVVADASGHGRDGTAHGATRVYDSVRGAVMEFDGSSHVEAPLDQNAIRELTYAFWINPGRQEGPYYGTVISCDNGQYGRGYNLHVSNSHQVIFFDHQAEFHEEVIIPPGRWTHVAAVFSPGSNAFYVNGRLVRSNFAFGSEPPYNDHTNLYLGVRSQFWDRFFSGRLDDVRVYGRALTAREVGSLQRNEASGVRLEFEELREESNLVLHYDFDRDEGGRVTDRSTSGFDGAVVGAVFEPNGRMGGAMRFSGGSWIDVGPVLDVGVQQPELTASIWFKTPPAPGASYALLAKNEDIDWTYTGWALRLDPRPHADLIARFPERAPASHDVDLFDDQWHHLVGVFRVKSDGLASRLYIDGRLAATSEWNGVHAGTETIARLLVGNRDPNHTEGYAGLLDDVNVYGRALTDDQVARLHRTGAADACPARITRIWTATDGCGNSVSATQVIRVVAADKPADDDHDMIPDEWETRRGLSVGESNAGLDSDADGVSDRDEFMADTDPLDPTDYFRQEQSVSPDGRVTITYRSSIDRLYSLQYSHDMAAGEWTFVPGQIDIPGTGGIDALSHQPDSPSCIYRVVARPY